jgi:hypothetical protein
MEHFSLIVSCIATLLNHHVNASSANIFIQNGTPAILLLPNYWLPIQQPVGDSTRENE